MININKFIIENRLNNISRDKIADQLCISEESIMAMEIEILSHVNAVASLPLATWDEAMAQKDLVLSVMEPIWTASNA